MNESTIDAKTDAKDQATSGAKAFPRWRRWTAGALIVISCVLVPLSVLAVWVRGQVLNTDRYVANITPARVEPRCDRHRGDEPHQRAVRQGRRSSKSSPQNALHPRADFLAGRRSPPA